MLKRNIDFDAFEPTLEEKIFRTAKRVCVVFAVSAVTLSALDLANIRTVENAAAFIHENRSRVSELPEQIRSAIDSLSFAAVVESATVVIPRGDIAAAPRPLQTLQLTQTKGCR